MTEAAARELDSRNIERTLVLEANRGTMGVAIGLELDAKRAEKRVQVIGDSTKDAAQETGSRSSSGTTSQHGGSESA